MYICVKKYMYTCVKKYINICLCERERESERASERVCVCESERTKERERERAWVRGCGMGVFEEQNNKTNT